MTIVKLTSGHEFESKDAECIIESAHTAGVFLPFSCSNGRCGACKVRVISGSTRANSQELGLDADEKEAGWILACIRTALTDISCDVGDFVNIELPKVRTVPCKIHAIQKLTRDTAQIDLRMPRDSHLGPLAGQHISVQVNGGLKRSYSIASYNNEENVVSLIIKRVEGGAMSEYWFEEAKVGNLLRFRGPLGSFVLRDAEDKIVVFLATGTGIAPVLFMLSQIAQSRSSERPRETYVLWGVRGEADVFIDISDHYPFCKFIPCVSKPTGGWVGETIYVQEAAAKLNLEWENVDIYACGSEKMIADAQIKFGPSGKMPVSRFTYDAFVASD